jgi:uncharacterized protein involved in outer membrane biogenesis
VRKLIKGLLIAAGAILALAAIAVLAMNLYVQSAGTQRRIEAALSSGLKAPVRITSTTVTPWGGLKVAGIAVPQPSPSPGNFLEAASFTAKFAWLPLFHRRLDISEVSLNEPCVEWFQSPGGRWELPNSPRVPPPGPQPSPANTPAASPTAAPVATPQPAGSPLPPPPAKPAWEINVHKLEVNGASFDFWDERGVHLLQFAGVQFECLDPSAAGTQGHASCKYITLHDAIYFTDMETDWSFGGGMLKLTSFQTEVGGGQIRGDAQVATQTRRSPFSANVTFDGVDVNQLMVEAGQEDGQITGTLKGRIALTGNTGKSSSLNGTAHLELAGGTMRNIELLQMLGQGLQIPDLVEMNLKTAEADARVVNGVIKVDKLVLESQNLQLAANGAIDAGGKLGLKARLTIDGAISDRLPSFILGFFKADPAGNGAHYIDFTINNTLSNPKTDLLQNLLRDRMQDQMGGLLQSIFGKKKPAVAPQQPEP